MKKFSSHFISCLFTNFSKQQPLLGDLIQKHLVRQVKNPRTPICLKTPLGQEDLPAYPRVPFHCHPQVKILIFCFLFFFYFFINFLFTFSGFGPKPSQQTPSSTATSPPITKEGSPAAGFQVHIIRIVFILFTITLTGHFLQGKVQ